MAVTDQDRSRGNLACLRQSQPDAYGRPDLKPADGDTRAEENLVDAGEIVRMGGVVRAHPFAWLPGTPLARALPALICDDAASVLGRLALEGKLEGHWRTAEDLFRGKTA